MAPDLERLRFLLAGLREDKAPRSTERRLLEEFKRLWPRQKP